MSKTPRTDACVVGMYGIADVDVDELLKLCRSLEIELTVSYETVKFWRETAYALQREMDDIASGKRKPWTHGETIHFVKGL